jgi:PAS domain S-box-containing protein
MALDDELFLSRIRRILEGSTVPATITDPEGHVLFVNQATERLLGRSLKEVMGTRASRYFVEAEQVRGHGRRAAQGDRVEEEQVHLIHADGRHIPLAMVIADLRDEQNNHLATVGLAVDLSQQRHLKRRLRDARDRLRFYHDLMTHDLRNYAQTMGGYLESLLAGQLGPLSDEQMRVLRICRRQTRRTHHLLSQVNALLQTHEAEAHGARAHLSTTPLPPLVDEAMKRVAADYADREPCLEAEVPERAQVRVGDRFTDVLYHVISNAVVHNPAPEPKVWIRAEPCTEPSAGSPADSQDQPGGEASGEPGGGVSGQPGGEASGEPGGGASGQPGGEASEEPSDTAWRIIVADNGPGLPDSLRAQVLTDSGSFQRPGAGVGLRLVSALLRQCGGRLRLEDRVAGEPHRGVQAIIGTEASCFAETGAETGSAEPAAPETDA